MDSPWWSAVGSFLGVVLGFLSARLGELLKHQHERGSLHRAALSRVYDTSNEYLNDIAEMVDRADHARAGAQRGALSWRFPCELAIDRTYYRDLLDSRLVDRLIQFNIMLARYNRLVVDLRQMSFSLQDAYVAGHVQDESWRDFLKQQDANLETIQKFLFVVDDRVRDLAVRASLLGSQFSERRARLFRMIGLLRVWDLTLSAVDKERRQFDEGIEASRKRNVAEGLVKVTSIDKSEL